VFEDTASGTGRDVLERNRGLRDALQEATKWGVPLLVWRPCRIARNAGAIKELLLRRGVRVISVVHGGLITWPEFAVEAVRYQREAEEFAQRTRIVLKEAKTRGQLLGNRKNLSHAQLRGAIWNKTRAEEHVEKIAEILMAEGAESHTAREIVDLLNAKGLRTRQGREWTIGAVRRPLAAARKLIGEQLREQEEEIPNFGRF